MSKLAGARLRQGNVNSNEPRVLAIAKPVGKMRFALISADERLRSPEAASPIQYASRGPPTLQATQAVALLGIQLGGGACVERLLDGKSLHTTTL